MGFGLSIHVNPDHVVLCFFGGEDKDYGNDYIRLDFADFLKLRDKLNRPEYADLVKRAKEVVHEKAEEEIAYHEKALAEKRKLLDDIAPCSGSLHMAP